MIDDAMNVVTSALRAFNAGDAQGFLDHIDDRVRFWMNGTHLFSGLVEGKAAFVDLVTRVNAGLSEPISLEVVNAIPAGEWAVIEAQGTAVTASGKPYRNRYCMLWRVAGGKIVEFKEYNDSALVEAELQPDVAMPVTNYDTVDVYPIDAKEQEQILREQNE